MDKNEVRLFAQEIYLHAHEPLQVSPSRSGTRFFAHAEIIHELAIELHRSVYVVRRERSPLISSAWHFLTS